MTPDAFLPTRRRVLGLIGASALWPQMGRAGAVDQLSGRAFGTEWRVTAAAGLRLETIGAEVERFFARTDRIFSPWRPDSDLSRFNAGDARWHASDPALVHVASAALDIAKKSGGTFDPTVGPLVARWGFGPIHDGGAPDWRGLATGPEGLTKDRSDLTLDLCGIAKGWALDRAVGLVRRRGVSDLLFDLGGEFLSTGQHPTGRDWRVAVEAAASTRPHPAILRLPSGTAVATSGTSAQSYEREGRTYSHIMDPAAGAPVRGELRSVSVIAETAMIADAWATALCAAGDEAGPDLAAQHGVAALFLFEVSGKERQVRTGPVADFIL